MTDRTSRTAGAFGPPQAARTDGGPVLTSQERDGIERFLHAIPGSAKWSEVRTDSAPQTTHSVTVEYEHEGAGDIVPSGYRLAALYGLDEAGTWSWRAGWGLPGSQASVPTFAPVKQDGAGRSATARGFLWRVRICRDDAAKVGAAWARAWTRRGARRAVTVPEGWTVTAVEKLRSAGTR